MTFFTRYTRVSLIFVPHFELSLKPLTCSNAATFILRPLSAGGGGGGFGSVFYRKFMNCLLKRCEIWKKGHGQFKH